jgi:hypothetical protein
MQRCLICQQMLPLRQAVWGSDPLSGFALLRQNSTFKRSNRDPQSAPYAPHPSFPNSTP